MNERIRELVNQCRGDPMTSEFEPRFDKEKFAKLIVKECAEFCDSNNSKLLGTMMKEHFGVEE